MQHAFEQLEKGDRLQASEKAWGAMVHALMQIAKERKLKYDTHAQARPVMERVARNSPYRDVIRSGYIIAEDLHKNFYDDVQTREDLPVSLQYVWAALELLWREQAKWREARRQETDGPGQRKR